MITRRCFRCREVKPVSEFYRSNVRYYQRECKICNRERKYHWHHTEQGKRSSANTKLKRRFGITIDQYEEMVFEAANKCEICGSQSSNNGHRLGIDHDHETGRIRGILCKACNVALAHFKEDSNILYNAIRYVEKVKNGKATER